MGTFFWLTRYFEENGFHYKSVASKQGTIKCRYSTMIKVALKFVYIPYTVVCVFDSKIVLKCDVACYEQVSFRYSRLSSKHQEVNDLFIFYGIIQIKFS